MSHHKRSLLEVQFVLQPQILPLLDGPDLGSLACTSKAFNSRIGGLSDVVWEAAARRFLPRTHPLPKLPVSSSSIQETLRAYGKATSNIKAGRASSKLIRAQNASFSATGSHLAVETSMTPTGFTDVVKIYEMKTQHCVRTFQNPEEGSLTAEWGSSGTMGLLKVWLDDDEGGCAIILCYGDLVNISESVQGYPWGLETLSLADGFMMLDYYSFCPAPDLSKVMISMPPMIPGYDPAAGMGPGIYTVRSGQPH
ncbi:hypothetical protein WJX73_003361 [Symbiochloris irregularis]|uniref:F-box domain-containing protein n=1 Tax=Symbiochloris irregularis TaxID=706552 RepID=A0AAW1NZC5_9CHLO